MRLPGKPAFAREPCEHRIANHPDGPMVFDDWLHMNIQSGSQWDGFRHYGHQSHGRFYNNLTPEEVKSGTQFLLLNFITQSLMIEGTRCGIQAVSDHGIVGRGVLLDYYGWCVRNERSYDPFTSHAIQLEDLLAVAKEQNVSFEVGDILLVRSGYTFSYYKYEKEDPKRLVEAGTRSPNLAGLAQTEEMKTWLHDS